MKKLLALVVAALLPGCAGWSPFLAGAQRANDDAIVVWSTAACATPLSAVLRNPKIIPALKELCMQQSVAPAAILETGREK